MTKTKEVSNESIKNAITSLLNSFQEKILREAIESGKVPANIETMTKKEVVAWYNFNTDGSEQVESVVLKILETNHKMSSYEASVTINKYQVENYVRSIIQVLMGNTCCMDKAREVVRDLIKSYQHKTGQYDRDYSHPEIASKRLWKKVIETCPIITLSRPVEHAHAVLELELMYLKIKSERERFLEVFYKILNQSSHLFIDGDGYELAKALNTKEYIFPMPRDANSAVTVVSGLLLNDSFNKSHKNLWNLYLYIKKYCPKSVRRFKKIIKAVKKAKSI